MLLAAGSRCLTAVCLSGIFLSSVGFAFPSAAQTAASSAAPKKQLPADQRAFHAAQAVTDPEKRLAALRQFIQQFPKSTRVDRAQSEILDVLLKNFPDRAAEIDAQAKLLVKKSGKGETKLSEESNVADNLADAGTHGVDLATAEKFARDAADKLMEPPYDKEMTKAYKKYKQPRPSTKDLHDDFAEARANALSALADVCLREGDLPQATAALDEAYALDPMVDEVNALRGEVALAQHKDAEALTDFERAQLLGELKARLRSKMMALYAAQHGGSDAGFVAEMDARYAELYPAPQPPAMHTPVASGHTVLLELFTGSACPPCVGGDLAVDDILASYPRNEVVALAFDQHIPEPDPLANPDSEARADVYHVASTPSYVVDGKLEQIYGGRRTGSGKLYDKLVKDLNPELAKPCSVQLKLSADRSSGTVHVVAVVVTGDSNSLAEKTPPPPPPVKPDTPDNTKPTPPPAATFPAPSPQLVLNFALVEDDVRYSGENGVRFHRMVVRSLAKPADGGFPVEPSKTATVDATFDLTEISQQLGAYLAKYEKSNPRFGEIEFLSKDTTMQPNHLAVAAWVQDETTHRVLQSAYFPLGGM